MFSIPTSVRLGGKTITVSERDTLHQRDNAYGMYSPSADEITLQSNGCTWVMSKATKEQSFCHELVHAILGVMNEDTLDGNERFVDVFGTFLHQALSTSKYSPEQFSIREYRKLFKGEIDED